MSILHSVLSSHALCQPVLIVSTSVKKYRSGVPFKELTTSLAVYIYALFLGLKKLQSREDIEKVIRHLTGDHQMQLLGLSPLCHNFTFESEMLFKLKNKHTAIYCSLASFHNFYKVVIRRTAQYVTNTCDGCDHVFRLFP